MHPHVWIRTRRYGHLIVWAWTQPHAHAASVHRTDAFAAPHHTASRAKAIAGTIAEV